MGFIYLIRHGQASFGKENYDILSQKGIEQSIYLGKELNERKVKIHQVFSGDMMRHLDTARHCIEQISTARFDILKNSDLNEYDHRDIIEKFNPRYNDFNKIKFDIIASLRPKKKTKEIMEGIVNRWTSGEYKDYNETWEDYTSRVNKGVIEIRNSLGKDQNAIVFTSAGAISVIMRQLLDLNVEKTFRLQLHIANASITTLRTRKTGIELVSFNDYSHFLKKSNLLTFI
jgi:broad specificity phosphatase PhoE